MEKNIVSVMLFVSETYYKIPIFQKRIIKFLFFSETYYKISFFPKPPVAQFNASVALWCDSATVCPPLL